MGDILVLKKKKKKIVLEFFSFKEGGVHMGGLAKIGCEGSGFNIKKLNHILVLSFSKFSKII